VRYRPVGKSGIVVSALSLGLCEDGLKRGPADWTNLIFAALENGINCFEVLTHSPAIAEGFARALTSVERELLFVAWRLGKVGPEHGPVRSFSPSAVLGQLRAVLSRSGLGYLDLAMLDDPKAEEAGPDTLKAMAEARDAGEARMLGISGADEAIEPYIASGAFDVLGTPYNLTSGWRERNWLRAAGAKDMAVFGYEPYPIEFHRAVSAMMRQQPKGRVEALHGCGSYAFLDATANWTAEEICVAYALTEPGLATIQIHAPSLDRLERLAETPEREMPPGLSAQIEMARFAPAPEAERERQRA
jgi:aryl-alcohol dehydrogenase-like predicted oxidoreductase